MDKLDDVDIDDDVDTELEVDTLKGIKRDYLRKKKNVAIKKVNNTVKSANKCNIQIL